MQSKPILIASVVLVFAAMSTIGYLLTTEIAGRFFSAGPSFDDGYTTDGSVLFRDESRSKVSRDANTETEVDEEVVPEKTIEEENRFLVETAEQFIAAAKPSPVESESTQTTSSPPEFENPDQEQIPSDLDPDHAFDSASTAKPLIAGGINPSSLQSDFSGTTPRSGNNDSRNKNNVDGDVDQTTVLSTGEIAVTETVAPEDAEFPGNGNAARPPIETPASTSAEASVGAIRSAEVAASVDVTPPLPASRRNTPAAAGVPNSAQPSSDRASTSNNRVVVGGRVSLDYSKALAGSVSGLIGGMQAPAAESQRIQYSPRSGYVATGTGNTVVTVPDTQFGISGSVNPAANSSSAAAKAPPIAPATNIPAFNSSAGRNGNIPANAGDNAVRNVVPKSNRVIPSLPVNVPSGAGVNAPGLNIKVNRP